MEACLKIKERINKLRMKLSMTSYIPIMVAITALRYEMTSKLVPESSPLVTSLRNRILRPDI
jgi:hypothetical protein